MKLRKLIEASIWYGVVPKATVLLNVLVMPLVTPLLRPSDFGVWGVISAYVGLGTSLCCFGLNIFLPNAFFEYKSRFKPIWQRIHFLMSMSAVLSSFFVFLLILFSIHQETPNYLLAAFLSIIPMWFAANTQIVSNFYTIHEKPRPFVIRKMIAGMSGVLVFFISVRYFHLGFYGWMLSSITTAAMIFLLFFKSIWLSNKLAPTVIPSLKRIKKWYVVALPAVPHTLGHTLLDSSDRIMMSLLGIASSSVGIYTIGYQFGGYAVVIVGGIFTAIGPSFQRFYREKDWKAIRIAFLNGHILATGTVFMLGLWMSEFFTFLVKNTALNPGIDVATVTCFSYSCFSLYVIMSIPPIVQKRTKTLLWLVFVPATLNIILNFIFLPIFGYFAAAVTTMIAYWSVPIIAMVHPFYRNEMKAIMGTLWIVVGILTFAILLLGVVQIFSHSQIGIKIIVSLIFFVSSTVAYRQIHRKL